MRDVTTLAAWFPTWADEGSAGDAWVDRQSGAPWGLDARSWPICGICRTPLSFIGQLGADRERLPSLPEGYILYAFLCTNPNTMMKCGFSAGVPGNLDGAHTVVVARVTERPNGPTLPPAPLVKAPSPGLVAVGWNRTVEEVAASSVEHFVYGLCRTRRDWLPDSHEELDEYCCDEERAAFERTRVQAGRTKLGGRPTWMQDPWFQLDDVHAKRFKYVATWNYYEDSPVTGRSEVTTVGVGQVYLFEDTMAESPASRFDLYYMAR